MSDLIVVRGAGRGEDGVYYHLADLAPCPFGDEAVRVGHFAPHVGPTDIEETRLDGEQAKVYSPVLCADDGEPAPPADRLAELDALLAEAQGAIEAPAQPGGYRLIKNSLREAIAIVETLRGATP